MFLFTYLRTVGVETFVHWSHSNTHTLGRTPLHEGSTCHCDFHLTAPMHPVGFEPTIATIERPQTHALDRTAKRILKVFWSSLLPLHLKPSFPFILPVLFYCYCFILCPFLFLLISLCSLYFVGSSTFRLFVFHLFLCSILSFLGDTQIHTKNRQTGISIISFERYTSSTKEYKGSLPKIWKKKNLENNFMKCLLTEIQCTSRWNSQFQTGTPPPGMIAISLRWHKY